MGDQKKKNRRKPAGDYLRPAEAAELLGVSVRTVRTWRRDGLKSAKMGTNGAVVMRVAWIDEYLESKLEENAADARKADVEGMLSRLRDMEGDAAKS